MSYYYTCDDEIVESLDEIRDVLANSNAQIINNVNIGSSWEFSASNVYTNSNVACLSNLWAATYCNLPQASLSHQGIVMLQNTIDNTSNNALTPFSLLSLSNHSYYTLPQSLLSNESMASNALVLAIASSNAVTALSNSLDVPSLSNASSYASNAVSTVSSDLSILSNNFYGYSNNYTAKILWTSNQTYTVSQDSASLSNYLCPSVSSLSNASYGFSNTYAPVIISTSNLLQTNSNLLWNYCQTLSNNVDAVFTLADDAYDLGVWNSNNLQSGGTFGSNLSVTVSNYAYSTLTSTANAASNTAVAASNYAYTNAGGQSGWKTIGSNAVTYCNACVKTSTPAYDWTVNGAAGVNSIVLMSGGTQATIQDTPPASVVYASNAAAYASNAINRINTIAMLTGSGSSSAWTINDWNTTFSGESNWRATLATTQIITDIGSNIATLSNSQFWVKRGTYLCESSLNANPAYATIGLQFTHFLWDVNSNAKVTMVQEKDIVGGSTTNNISIDNFVFGLLTVSTDSNLYEKRTVAAQSNVSLTSTFNRHSIKFTCIS